MSDGTLSSARAVATLSAVPASVWAALGERLRALGFGGSVLAEAERILPARHDVLRLPLVQRALRRAATDVSTLARLFVYDDLVEPAAAEAALGGALAGALVEAGLLVREGEGLASRVRVTPFAEVLVVSDPTHGDDPVIPPGPTTLDLVRALPALAGRSVLDLGAGPGSLAALAAHRGAATVTATDVSERALELARATAALNGTRFETLSGDLEAPVRGRRFDLVLCQPPFVPQPRALARTTYLHGGLRGDELARRAIDALPGLLAEGGEALLRIDLPGSVDDVAARLQREVPTACVAFLARGPSASELAMAYAAAHRRELGADLARDAVAYADHFDEEGIREMTAVLLSAWLDPAPRRTVRVVPSLASVDARAIASARAAPALAELPDAELLALALVPPPGARMRVTTVLGTGRATHLLEAPGQLARELSDPVALLVDVLAQGATLGEAADALARATDAPPGEADALTARFARDALRSGLLQAS